MTDFTPRPTVYNGVKMRSRLEAGYAAWLDQEHHDWQYEPGAFSNTAGQYLPDFRLNDVWCSWLGRTATVYVEVKPGGWPFEDENDQMYERLMRSMAIIWTSEPDAVLILEQPETNRSMSDPCRVGILDGSISPATDPAFPWPYVGHWGEGPNGRPSLSQVWNRWRGPWPDEWWKVKT